MGVDIGMGKCVGIDRCRYTWVWVLEFVFLLTATLLLLNHTAVMSKKNC